MICPQDMWQLFHQFFFRIRIIQPLLKSVYYDFVNSLGLSIPLGVSWGRIFVRNSQIIAVSLKRFVIKLKTIIRDEGMRDPEPGDNVFLDNLFGIHISDIRQKLNFNPFGEIVRADLQISFVLCCFGERGNNIQAPQSKWPGAG